MIASPITIRPGDDADTESVLRLLDKAIDWLVRAGRTGQWGEQPFSTSPARRTQIERTLTDGMLRIAEVDDIAVGASVLARHPTEYVSRLPVPELYLHLLVSDRDLPKAGVGRALVRDAADVARQQRVQVLRVDCYAGDDRALVRAYERLGFIPSTPLLVARPGLPTWPGQVLAMAIDADGDHAES